MVIPEMWPIVSRLSGGCVAAVWRCERLGADLDVAGAGLGVVDGEGELELLALRDVLEVDVRVVAGAIVEGRRGVVADGDAVRAAEDREDDGLWIYEGALLFVTVICFPMGILHTNENGEA